MPPPVEDAQPPPIVIRLFNPVLKALLRSPLHRLVDRRYLLLTMTGRRTGRTITVPVGRHEGPDGSLLVSASGGWRYNLRGGADVRLTLDGSERPARAEAEEDLDRAAETMRGMVERTGPRALALKVHSDRPPSAAALKPLLARRDIVHVRLGD